MYTTLRNVNRSSLSLLFFLLMMASLPVLGQGSETRVLNGFDELHVGQAIEVILISGSSPKAVVETKNIATDNVITEVKGDMLKIGMKRGNFRKTNVKVYLTYTQLKHIEVSSAADVYAEEVLQVDGITLSASSAGNIQLSLKTDRTKVKASSGGDILLKGKTTELDAHASSGGEIKASGLIADNVTAHASSAGDVTVNATESLDAHASSAGTVKYKGSATKSNIHSSSGGSVRKY